MAKLKIGVGFHSGTPCACNGIGDYISGLAADGHVITAKSVDGTASLMNYQEARYNGAEGYGIYRVLQGHDVPNYGQDIPLQAAAYIKRLNDEWPPELDKSLFHVELINEVDKNESDWIGFFMVELAKMAMSYGYNFAGPGWSTGEPEKVHWQTTGMLAYLRLCEQYPKRLAVAVHDYAFNNDMADMIPFQMGRVVLMNEVCRENGISLPDVLISEFGWSYNEAPHSADGTRQIIEMVEWYIENTPNVKAVHLWCLDRSDAWKDLPDKINGYMEPLSAAIKSNDWKLPDDDKPQEKKVDLRDYLRGDGRLYEVTNANGGGERFQTQRYGWEFWQTKNANAEQLFANDRYIFRGWDTSPGGGRYYQLQQKIGKVRARWMPRIMEVGEVYTVSCYVQFYTWNCVPSDPNSGWVTDTRELVAHYPTWTSRAGITLNDVIQIEWVNGGEVYYYARDYGLVGWERKHQDPNTPQWSAISEIHEPGQRPDNVVNLPDCFDSPNPPDPDWKQELWDKSIVLQTIELNPDSALQAAIFADGFVPVESEFWHTVDDVKYAAQGAERLDTGARRVYYAIVPNWDNVHWFTKIGKSNLMIVDIVAEMPKHPTKTYNTRDLSDVTTAVIHHTVSPSDFLTENIAHYHIQTNGWPGIGYHYIVDYEGYIEMVNYPETVSYHVAGSNNYTVGIALKGNFTTISPTDAQIDAAGWLIEQLKKDMPINEVIGHKEADGASTACPGDTWAEWKDRLAWQH